MYFNRSPKSQLAALSCITFLVLLSGCEDNTEIAPEKQVQHTARAITYAKPVSPPSKVFYGKIQGSIGYDIASFSDGRVDSMLVKEGEYVKKGQLLAKLYSPSLEAVVLQRQAQLNAAITAADDSVRELKRVTNLHQKNLAPEATLEQAQRAAQIAAESVLEAKALLSQARNQLKDISIFAIEDGLIARLFAREGQFVSSSEPIIRLEEIGKQKIQFSIPESDAFKLSVGDTVQVFIRASKKTFKAKVTEKAIPKLSGPSLFSVTVELQAHTPQSLGLTAQLRIPLTERQVYSIDASAVRFMSDGKSYLLDDNLRHYAIEILATRQDKLLISTAALIQGIAFNTSPEPTLQKNLMIAKEGTYE
ncbi:hypothetical protein A7985_08735 [Pseudoalteromonas luteoviolacea]|uniref:Uncharacterized protein n=1 Tax=Pseudoalteromonas luteoviolacea TaxID=43657 RepID=A0A1C0TRK4_9GAMM|nr:efflux RND transporter periplasmic adaptor subunit [Pseudoalteromonas luteoviolacea]OCQ21885.1 hypothetical protein A7985_08735 [Pseudoalteromonas luteoviolacea]